MTIILYNLTGKIDKKTVALLSEIDTIARDLKLTFFIVGATARDILLQHAYGIHITRATLDVDIGVFVSDWDQFRTLKEALVHMGKFSPTRQTQRLLFEDEFRLDIIPFEGIALEGEAAPSQDHKIAMDVLRQDAFQKEPYEQVVEYFNALQRGLLD